MAAKNNTLASLKAIPEYMVTKANKELGDFVSKVEKLKDQEIYRVTLNGEEAPAFIEKFEKAGKTYDVFYHYCEQNEKDVACKHLPQGMAIGKRIGFNITHALTKSTPAFIQTKDKYDDKEYDTLNGSKDFKDLLAIVEDESVEEEPTTPVTTTPKPKTTTITTSKRNWRTEWPSIEEYLKTEGAGNRLVVQVQQKRMNVHNTVAITATTNMPAKPDTPYQGKAVLRAIRHILNGSDLIFIGEKGSGKDTLIATIAWIFGYPTTLVTGNGDEDKESLIEEPAFINNESTHVKSAFTKSVENGDLVNFAEINMLQGDVTAVFHSLLDDNASIPSKLGLIKRHPEHLIIGSMNVGEGYSGIKELNEAFKDRFTMMRLPYGNFRSIIQSKSGLKDKSALDFLEKIKTAIDKLIANNDGEGSSAKTIRGYIKAAQYLKEFGVTNDTKVECIEDNIINKVTDFEEMCAIREAIREYAWTDFPLSEEEEQYINAGGGL